MFLIRKKSLQPTGNVEPRGLCQMPDISKRLEKAERYLQKSKPEAALDEYFCILEEDPDNGQVRQTAADLCLSLGRNNEAATLLSYLFDQEVKAGESASGSVTYKKLAKIVTPTAQQTFHYAQFIEKRDKKEALEAYEAALNGFDAQGRDKLALMAARKIVELAPTEENLQRAGEKSARLGEGRNASIYFIQLGKLKDEVSSGTGFEWYEKAFQLDAANLEAAFLYALGLFGRNSLTECKSALGGRAIRVGALPERSEASQ